MIVTLSIALGLVILSALFSGLTLGLMGLNVHDLKRKADLGDEDAAAIYPIRKDGNLLLTTLLLGNVAVNTVLAVLLADFASGLIASLIATSLIFLLVKLFHRQLFHGTHLLLVLG